MLVTLNTILAEGKKGRKYRYCFWMASLFLGKCFINVQRHLAMGEYNSHHINGLRSKLWCQEWRRVKGDQEAGKADLIYQHIGHWVGRFWQTLRHTGWTHVGASTEATGRHKQVFAGYLESWRMKGKTRASDPKAILIQNRTQKWHIARVIQEVLSPTANFCSFLDTSY